MVLGIWYHLVFGVWCLVIFGIWCLVFGIWCLVLFGVWCLVFGVWCGVQSLGLGFGPCRHLRRRLTLTNTITPGRGVVVVGIQTNHRRRENRRCAWRWLPWLKQSVFIMMSALAFPRPPAQPKGEKCHVQSWGEENHECKGKTISELKASAGNQRWIYVQNLTH